MDEDERAPAALCHEVGAQDRLADAGRSHEDTRLVLEKGARSRLLERRELATERHVELRSLRALVLDDELHALISEQGLEVGQASTGDCQMLWKVLGAGDDSRRAPRRQAHPLLLVELGILEGGEPLNLVEQRRGQARLLDEEPLGAHDLQLGWQRTSETCRLPAPGRQPRPRRGVLRLDRLCRADADHEPLARRLTGEALDALGCEPRDTRKKVPLIRPWLQRVVDEQRVAKRACFRLERQRDEVAEPTPRQGVLVRKEAVVRVHAELVAARHRLGEKKAAHAPRNAGVDRLREEEPDVGPIPGARAFDCGLQADGPASLDEGSDIFRPGLLVEVGGKEPGGLVFQHRVDADDVAAVEVVEDDLVGDRQELAAHAFPALDPLAVAQGADAERPEVAADGRIALPAPVRLLPVLGVDIHAPAEQLAEEPKLVDAHGRLGDRCAPSHDG